MCPLEPGQKWLPPSRGVPQTGQRGRPLASTSVIDSLSLESWLREQRQRNDGGSSGSASTSCATRTKSLVDSSKPRPRRNKRISTEAEPLKACAGDAVRVLGSLADQSTRTFIRS